jgi:hypothetical protein
MTYTDAVHIGGYCLDPTFSQRNIRYLSSLCCTTWRARDLIISSAHTCTLQGGQALRSSLILDIAE